MPNYWQGQKVRLRAIESDDAEFFLMLSQDTERTRFIDWLTPPTSLEAIQARFEKKIAQGMQDYAFQWMIESLDGQTVGSIVTQSCDPMSGTFSYALDVAREFQRQGYASEAIQIVLRYYFEELRFQKVTIAVHSNNIASIELHKHLGFQHEGTNRRMSFSNGTYHDLEWYGLTEEEFAQMTQVQHP
ncbi:MAG: GNAT family N-acetyltransferase [Chloroflexota bacterium]